MEGRAYPRIILSALLSVLALLAGSLLPPPTTADSQVGLDVVQLGWDGNVVPGTQFNLGCGGYGGLIDANGIL